MVEPIYRRRSSFGGRARSLSKTYRDSRFEEVVDENVDEEEDDSECTSADSNMSSQPNESDNENTIDSAKNSDSFPFKHNSGNSNNSDDFVSFEISQRTDVSISRSKSAGRHSNSSNDQEDSIRKAKHGDSSSTAVREYRHHKSLVQKNVTFISNRPANTHCNISDLMHVDQRFSAVLYIQMELCGINLRQYLDKRNSDIIQRLSSANTSTDKKDVLDYIDLDLERQHFEQILSGVQYIHSQNMIHRDLKVSLETNIIFLILLINIISFKASKYSLQP